MDVERKEGETGPGETRPAVLFPLFAPAATLRGVGPDVVKRLARLLDRDEPRVVDLLFHRPTGLLDPTPATALEQVLGGEPATLEIEVRAHIKGGVPKRPWKVKAHSGFGDIELAFFNADRLRLDERLPVGRKALVHGRVTRWNDRLQMAHPEILGEAGRGLGKALSLYPLSEGLGHGRLRALVGRALERLPQLPEWLDASWATGAGWPAFASALQALHAPPTEDAEAARETARRRLALDELLATQLAMALLRRGRNAQAARPAAGDGRTLRELLTALPFTPTSAQLRAIDEITADLARPQPMLRLLQGDVGSGKTLVALAAMLTCADSGRQAALMAPTEVLALQHAATFRRLLEPLGIAVELLIGRERGNARAAALERVALGGSKLVIGTHALVQDGVAFADLGLAVVDEQHRFGVAQRLALSGKGGQAHLLLMTATPIPRTLVLGMYGEIATSRLDERPPGRKPIETRAVPLEREDDVLAGVARALERGERLYWICPAIDAGDAAAPAAVTERFEALRARFGKVVGLAHGQLKDKDRDRAMADFAAGRIRILVATTVVEVGVDVPEASVIIIESAERFGLAQLHQLRGRVGRGERASSCVLLYRAPLGKIAKQRLSILRETDDGFRIAEEDLRLRGPGEILGARQSGLPAFRFVDLTLDADLLDLAGKDAARIAASDARLGGPRGESLRILLHLFERQDAMGLLAGG